MELKIYEVSINRDTDVKRQYEIWLKGMWIGNIIVKENDYNLEFRNSCSITREEVKFLDEFATDQMSPIEKPEVNLENEERYPISFETAEDKPIGTFYINYRESGALGELRIDSSRFNIITYGSNVVWNDNDIGRILKFVDDYRTSKQSKKPVDSNKVLVKI